MGETKKVTKMVLKVDLQCDKCYRKVKKVLCKFPQIRDQTYDEKNNQVIIKVVCCNPEKFRDKLYCKGGCVITSIDIIIDPSPVKPTKIPPQPSPSTKEAKPPPTPCPCPPVKPCPTPCTCHPNPCMCLRVICTCPPVKCPRPPVNTCCTDCCGGHPGGPCRTAYGYGVQVYDSYCGWRSYNTRSYCVTRTDCFIEENTQACSIM